MLTDSLSMHNICLSTSVEIASIYFTTNFKAGNKDCAILSLSFVPFYVMLFSAVMTLFYSHKNHIQHCNHLGKVMSKIHSCLRHSEQFTFFHWSKIMTLKHKAVTPSSSDLVQTKEVGIMCVTQINGVR